MSRKKRNASPSPAPREREGPGPKGREGEGRADNLRYLSREPPSPGSLARATFSRGTGEGRRDQGFTLIEVLVAFAILALTFTALVRIFGSGLTAADRVARERAAILLARSQLANAGVETPLTLGASDGEGAEGYRWHVAVEPDPSTAALPSLPLLRRINVTVSWAEGGRERSLSLATLRLAPAPRP